MQVLARRRGFLALAALVLLGVLGFRLLRSPLEIPTLKIEPLAQIGVYPLRNSVLEAWLAMVVLLVIVFVATRKMKIVPGRLQGMVEAVVEALLNLVETAAGKRNGRRFFPVIATIFLFILACNWLGLLPGVGTVGVVVPAEEVIEEAKHEGQDLHKVELLVFNGGPVLTLPVASSPGEMAISAQEYEERHGAPEGKRAGHLVPFLRPANTDLNTPLAIALWSFIFVEFWGLSTLGLPYLGKFFNVRQILRGRLFEGFIDLFVGLLELVLEFVRLISFTFRLFGNIFAGEVLILLISFFFPLVFVVGVFAMELFFGAIQAFIFAILTLIFGMLAVTGHHGAAEQGHAEHGV